MFSSRIRRMSSSIGTITILRDAGLALLAPCWRQGKPWVALPRSLGRVAKWQTRWLQVPVFVRTWGFKSPLAHRLAAYSQKINPRISIEAVPPSNDV